MRKSQKSAVVAGSVIALVGGGVAFAYWTSTGNGTGNASTGTSTNYTVEVANNSASKLYPGAGTSTLSFKVTNTGSGHQYVSSASAVIDTLNVQTDVNKPACTAADFEVVGTPTIVAKDLANGEFTTGTVTVQMLNGAGNQDNCQGLSNVPVKVTVN